MKKEKSVASKKTLNLAMREKSSTGAILVLPAVLLIAAVAVLLSFAVGSRLAQVTAAQREVDQLRERTEEMKRAYADYDEVQAEYNRYTYKDFDRTIADRMDVLALIDREILPVCYVQRLTVSGRQLSMSLEGLTLETTSALITRLNADDLVERVEVSTYDATSASGAVYPVTDMTILLADASRKGEVE